MASPPSPSSSKPISTISTATAKKSPSLPWTHPETVHLIQAYQEKWYSLKRGQLKSSQWEEVAVTVAARCGYNYSEPSKTSTQCRHKIEKLRQRYRAEKKRIAAGGPCYWQYFDLMDRLERGPLPISARPISLIRCNDAGDLAAHHVGRDYADRDDDDDDEEEEEEEEVDDVDKSYGKSRSINYILRRPTAVNRFAVERSSVGDGVAKRGGIPGFWRRKREVEEENLDMVEGGRGGGGVGGEIVMELAGEIRAFADKFVGLETMKIEMMRETQRCRMEMENRRMEMIFESQKKIVNSISRAFASSPKRVKISPQI